jgi:hypothetical protein
MKSMILRALPAILMLLAATPALSDTQTYHGMGTYQVLRSVMPMASGAAAVQLSNNIVATIEPSASGFIFGSCAGLGLLAKDESYSAHTYCTFTETGDDAFDVKAIMSSEQGSAEIIGGSGKWRGATGVGSVKRKYAEGDRGSFEYEFEITTP